MSLLDGLVMWHSGQSLEAELGQSGPNTLTGSPLFQTTSLWDRPAFCPQATTDSLNLGAVGAGMAQYDMTVCGWVRYVSASDPIIARYDAAKREWDLQIVSSVVRWSISNDGNSTTHSAAAPIAATTNEWVFGCGIVNYADVRLEAYQYIPRTGSYSWAFTGLPALTVPDRGGVTRIGAQVQPATVGQHIAGCGVWSRALRSEEIFQLAMAYGQFPDDGVTVGAGGAPTKAPRFDGNPFAGVS